MSNVWSNCYPVSLGYTGTNWSFIEFYWVLLGFTGFYWVLLVSLWNWSCSERGDCGSWWASVQLAGALFDVVEIDVGPRWSVHLVSPLSRRRIESPPSAPTFIAGADGWTFRTVTNPPTQLSFFFFLLLCGTLLNETLETVSFNESKGTPPSKSRQHSVGRSKTQ